MEHTCTIDASYMCGRWPIRRGRWPMRTVSAPSISTTPAPYSRLAAAAACSASSTRVLAGNILVITNRGSLLWQATFWSLQLFILFRCGAGSTARSTMASGYALSPSATPAGPTATSVSVSFRIACFHVYHMLCVHCMVCVRACVACMLHAACVSHRMLHV